MLEERFRLVVILASVCAVFLICLGLMLLGLRTYLWGKIKNQEFLVASLKERSFTRAHDLKEIETVNARLTQVWALYDRRLSQAPIMRALASHMKEGMYLNSLTIVPSGELVQEGGKPVKRAKISVTGFAPLREDLFLFRQDMQKDPVFQNVYFPPSNWVKPSGIHFAFSANVHEP